MVMEAINFDQPTIIAFLKEYDQAVAAKKPLFKFQNKDVLVDYAKYVLEYLCSLGRVRRVWDSKTESFTFKP
jgi:hypothetical protein